jgi:hypothetical protein
VAVEIGVAVSVTDEPAVAVAVGTTGSGEAIGVVVVLAGATGVAAKLQDVRINAATRLILISS